MRQFGTTSLLVYWVHIELVYGRWLYFWKDSLSVPRQQDGQQQRRDESKSSCVSFALSHSSPSNSSLVRLPAATHWHTVVLLLYELQKLMSRALTDVARYMLWDFRPCWIRLCPNTQMFTF